MKGSSFIVGIREVGFISVFFQRLLNGLVYADRVLRSFNVFATRIAPLGARTHMDVVHKNAKEVAKFLNCWARSRSQIFEYSYEYLMVTEGKNFCCFYCDDDETVDSLITLYGCGTKICFLVKLGKFARQLEMDYASLGSLLVSCSAWAEFGLLHPRGWRLRISSIRVGSLRGDPR